MKSPAEAEENRGGNHHTGLGGADVSEGFPLSSRAEGTEPFTANRRHFSVD